jgi:hypothetical protein
VTGERSRNWVGLACEHVKAGAGEVSSVERLEQRGLVDECASSDVHESRTAPHSREGAAVDERRSSWFVARGQDHCVGSHQRRVNAVGGHELDLGYAGRGAAADVSPHADQSNLKRGEPSRQL